MAQKLNLKGNYFLLGLGIGSLIGVLFAPKSGEQTREYIATKTKEGNELALKKAQELRVRLEEAVENGIEMIAQTEGQFVSAINVGRETYRREKEKAQVSRQKSKTSESFELRSTIMSEKKIGVFGIYGSRLGVEIATDSLIRARFPASDISVLMPETHGGAKYMGTEKATKAPEGTAAGVTAGGVIGGTLGVLAGIGILAIPGLGPYIAAGPIMAGLAGLGVGGAVGGITGALIGIGIPEFEAKRYEGHLQKGGILLRRRILYRYKDN